MKQETINKKQGLPISPREAALPGIQPCNYISRECVASTGNDTVQSFTEFPLNTYYVPRALEGAVHTAGGQTLT